MMPRFRDDNTDGCTADQLAELNRLYDEQLARLSPDKRGDKRLQDHIAENVRLEFDDRDDDAVILEADILEWKAQFSARDLVLRKRADGWDLHVPLACDEDIDCGYSPPLLSGQGHPAAADYDEAFQLWWELGREEPQRH